MADVEIKGRLSVDTGSSGKSIADIKKEIKEAGAELERASQGSTAWEAANKRLAIANQQLKQATDQATQSQKQHVGVFGELKDRVTAMVPGLKGVESAGTGVNGIFKLISANPIVLILTALVGVLKWLYEAFTATKEGAEEVEAVFSGVKAAVQAVVDRVVMLGRAVIEFFKGNFKEAVNQAKGAVTGLVDEVSHAYAKAKELAKMRQEIRDYERQDAVDDSFNEVRRAQLKEMLSDEETAAKDKLRIARQLREELKEDAAKDMENEQKKLNVAIEQNKLKRFLSDEDRQKEADARIAYNKAAEEAALQEFQLNKMVRNAERQVAQEAKATLDERKAKAKEYADLQKQHAEDAKKRHEEEMQRQKEYAAAREKLRKETEQFNAEYVAEFKKQDELEEQRRAKVAADNKRIELENRKKLAELKLTNTPNSDKAKIDAIRANLALELNAIAEGDLQRQVLAQKAENEITKIKEDAVKARQALDQAEFESKMKTTTAVGGVLSQLGGLIGQQTAVGKGFAVAGALIDTYAAIAATLKNAAKTPAGGIPGYAVAQAIATGLAGFAAVRNILKVQVPGGSSGGPSISTVSPVAATAPIAPTASTTALNQSSINAVGNAATGGTNRSFVLDSDIKNNDERARRINRAARLA